MSSKHVKQIKTAEIFENLPEKDILLLLKKGDFKIRKYNKSSIIHIEGEICDKIEIILSGNVVIDSIDETGKFITITDFSKGDILGGNLIFSSNPYYPMTITALSETRICQINKDNLVSLLEKRPEVLLSFLKLISDNVSILSTKIKNSFNKTIREKISLYLTKQKSIQGTDKIRLSSSKTKLAEKMGIQRTSLSRELYKMKEDGMIDYSREYVEIINLKP
jgi:CRP-like cAMP-binding protein